MKPLNQVKPTITKDFAEFLAVLTYATKYGVCKPADYSKAFQEYLPVINSKYDVLWNI